MAKNKFMLENIPFSFPPLSGEYDGIIPEILAETAETVWQERKDLGRPVSKPVALGLVMKSEGNNNLRELLAGNSIIAPDPQFAIDELSEESKGKFLYSLGEVVLGSALEAVEKGVFEWDDRIFVSSFNEAIEGTPLPRIKLGNILEALKLNQKKQRIRTSREQREDIRKFLKDGGESFLPFLEGSYQSALLPQTIFVFIYELEPLAGKALAEVLPIYKEALKHLA